ncbi:hypothetical protein [Arenibaculum sp.]|uniref:hypothetical protein n=1 Tax=Arenibaculum sp. TaxID=2865862 RepID=UPI002E1058C3|nr:hypothetical protein [Arenibaculum sp.]
MQARAGVVAHLREVDSDVAASLDRDTDTARVLPVKDDRVSCPGFVDAVVVMSRPACPDIERLY